MSRRNTASTNDSVKALAKTFSPTFLGAWRRATRNPKATQADLAEVMGVSVGHLSNIERGKRQYTQEILEDAVLFLRRWFPSLQVVHLLTIDPAEAQAAEVIDPVIAELIDMARRIPKAQRDSARMILKALADVPPSETPGSEAAVRRVNARG